MNVDQLITNVTEAPTVADARKALNGVSRKTLEAIADQLYVDTADETTAAVKTAIISEARA